MRSLVIVLAAALVLGACGWFEDPSPNQARIVVEGESGKPVRLIISRKFVAAVNERGQTNIVIFESDTLVTTLPFSRSYNIEEDQRFFAETAQLDDEVANIRMQVFVDSRRQFDEGGPLREGQPYRFVYAFNQLVTREIVLL